MTSLQITAGTRLVGRRPHVKTVACWFVHDADGVVLSDHATLADAQHAAGIAPRSPAEIGAIAGLAFELNRRFGNALLGKPETVGIFDWIGQRAEAGDETALQAVAWLQAQKEAVR